MTNNDLLEALRAIDPAGCTYEEWYQVGMILKHEGFDYTVWDKWSQSDNSRYHDGECLKKWQTFKEEATKLVTAGTLVQMAYNAGWQPPYMDDTPIEWGQAITFDEPAKSKSIVDRDWLEGIEVTEPKDAEWVPADDLIRYLETLFQPEEYIGYCCESIENQREGKFVPANKGVYARTAGTVIDDLRKYRKNGFVAINEALSSDYNPEAGAWIRFNPLDGKGVKNSNVTDFRYALVESDSLSIEKQNEIIRKLELPIAALVTSGKKSLHAIVRINASSYQEYKTRVDKLYKICEQNGLQLDKQNRNPSRLSRMPGVMRAGRKQFLVDTNIGKEDWNTWMEWYAEQNDDLPEFESLADVWNNLPELAPPLIDGILRQGHKMLISGPSKAGKSFMQIELAIAIAEGKNWLGFPCAQGKTVYVNFELDRASCLHRFKDVYEALKIPPENLKNIIIWNLRGKSTPMDKLAPRLIRRARKINPICIILDPIYKVITGDENSADQMAKFCNQFDKVCTEVGCSVIYCHHHSKGAQGGKKAMDRASGSGVFARDPDALLDIIELPLKNSHYEAMVNERTCQTIAKYFDAHVMNWRENVSLDDTLSAYQMKEHAKEFLSESQREELKALCQQAEKEARNVSAWRVSCTLREFAKPDDKDMYFDYPLHYVDTVGVLKDIRPDIEINGREIHQRDKANGKSKAEKAEKEKQSIIDAYTLIAAEKEPDENGNIIVKIADFVERSEEFFGKALKRTGMRKKLLKFGDFDIDNGVVTPHHDDEEEAENEEDTEK